MIDIKKKKIIKPIIIILLIIIALAYPGYKLIYHLWYKNSSLDIIYYGCDNNYKTGKIEGSKYLFIMKDDIIYNTKAEPEHSPKDYVVNEKGQILNLAKDTKNGSESISISNEGKYISVRSKSSNVRYYFSNGKIVDEYDTTQIYPLLRRQNLYLIGASNGKVFYFNSSSLQNSIFDCSSLSLSNSKNDNIHIMKKLADRSSAYQCIDNDNIYIVDDESGYRISFYNTSDNTLIGTYNTYERVFAYDRYYNYSEYLGYADLYSPLYNPAEGHYIVVTTSNGFGYINYEGKLVIDYNYKKAEPFFLGCAKVEDKKGNSYFIDINENKVSAPSDTEKYTVQRKTSDNTFFAKSNSSDDRYLLDIDGNILRTFTSKERMYEFSDGYSFVYDYSQMNGYIINEKGETTVDMWKDVFSKFSNIKKISIEQKPQINDLSTYPGYSMPYVGLSDSGLFSDTVLDDKGRRIQVVFNNKGQIQFACNANNIAHIIRK